MKQTYLLSLMALLLFSSNIITAQNNILPLWPDAIPFQKETTVQEVHESTNILRVKKVQKPTLEVFLPSKQNATGQAVLIFPGGGYGLLSYDWEGTDIAKFLNAQGVAAFVVKTRLPSADTQTNFTLTPITDAMRAIRIVRSNAKQWNVDPQQIGIIGFSAGGHLASTLGTHYDMITTESIDSVDQQSARPDFMALIYPVISMKKGVTHYGSRARLIGKKPDAALVANYSNELQITKDTPPTFLVHSADDKAVPVNNSILFYTALQENKVPVEMHLYPSGGHGYGLGLGRKYINVWPNQLASWLQNIRLEQKK